MTYGIQDTQPSTVRNDMKKNTCFSSEDMYAAARDIGKSGVRNAKTYEAMLRQAAFVQETLFMEPMHFLHIAKEATGYARHLSEYFGKGFRLHAPMNYKPINSNKGEK